MKRIYGFTLIEILIALSIFAIIGVITSTTLYNSFTTRQRVNEQSTELATLQLAISMFQNDVRQAAERATLANDMHPYPAFIGQTSYIEFTKDGNINPENQESRSTLQRVAWLCKNGELKRRVWKVLDPINRKEYKDKTLLKNLKNCHFAYLNQTLEVFPNWRPNAINQDQHQETLPSAVQLNLDTNRMGSINLLHIISGGLYAKT